MSKEPILKIKFNQMTDFKFQAAYQSYSNLFDELSEKTVKRLLNNHISKLYGKEIDYIRFYKDINQFRDNPGGEHRFHRKKIKGQRKWAYNRAQQKINRIKRHKR